MFIGLSVCQQNYAKTAKLNLLTFTRSLMTYMVITRIFGGGLSFLIHILKNHIYRNYKLYHLTTRGLIKDYLFIVIIMEE